MEKCDSLITLLGRAPDLCIGEIGWFSFFDYVNHFHIASLGAVAMLHIFRTLSAEKACSTGLNG